MYLFSSNLSTFFHSFYFFSYDACNSYALAKGGVKFATRKFAFNKLALSIRPAKFSFNFVSVVPTVSTAYLTKMFVTLFLTTSRWHGTAMFGICFKVFTLTLGTLHLLFFDWDLGIGVGNRVFMYAIGLVFEIIDLYGFIGKIINPIGLIFNLPDR